ncbi:Large ribosomal subunit protein uL23z [Ranunculus cassubicifolius]
MAHLTSPLHHHLPFSPWTWPTTSMKNPTNLRKSTISATNKHDGYQILKFPLKTESTVKLIQQENTLVFISDVSADKTTIKDALKMINIKTKKVNTLTRPDRTKKVYVKLAPDYDAFSVATKIGLI